MNNKLTINDIHDIIGDIIAYKLPDNLDFTIGEDIYINNPCCNFQVNISLNQMFSLIRQETNNSINNSVLLISELEDIIDYWFEDIQSCCFYIFTEKTTIKHFGKDCIKEYNSESYLNVRIKGKEWLLPIYDMGNCLSVIQEIRNYIGVV